jgi:hypothetical protein
VQQAKRSKLTTSFVQGYLSSKAAQDDIDLISAHLDSGKHIRTFVKNVGAIKTRATRVTREQKEGALYGCVAKAVEKVARKKYKMYCKSVLKVGIVPISREEWDTSCNTERAKRAISRDPHTRYLYLLQGMESSEKHDNLRSIEDTVKYMRERKVTLAAFIVEEVKLTERLQKAVYSSSCYSLLMRAKFEEDSNIIDLTEERNFTFQNTSKEQLSRVSIQSYVVLSLALKLVKRSRQEIDMIQESLDLISCSEDSFEQLKNTVNEVLKKRNDFKVRNSMGAIVDRICNDCKNSVSQKKIRSWYNEFKEYGLFKEDLRGCYQRPSLITTP